MTSQQAIFEIPTCCRKFLLSLFPVQFCTDEIILPLATATLFFLFYLVYFIYWQYVTLSRYQQLLKEAHEQRKFKEAWAHRQLEQAMQQEKILLEELELKNKQLTSYSLNFIQKNELLAELKANLHELRKHNGPQPAVDLRSLSRLVEDSLQIDKDWRAFKRTFEEVHKDFFRILKTCYPDLTNHELKLCTLLRLNMNLKEAANIMGISPESVKKARHRLRRKFHLSREENLTGHILFLEKEANSKTLAA